MVSRLWTLLAAGVLCAGRSAMERGEDQRLLEHAVDWDQAWGAAGELRLAPEDRRRPGCDVCTPEEVAYCTGDDVVYDHCCCDRRYLEPFPFVPHACYLTRELCRPVANNCADYTRLRVCCCDRLTSVKWKALSRACNLSAATVALLFCLLTHVLLQS